MEKEKTLKLILYKDCKEVEVILEENTKKGLDIILNKVEEWKNEDKKKNTVKFIIEKDK